MCKVRLADFAKVQALGPSLNFLGYKVYSLCQISLFITDTSFSVFALMFLDQSDFFSEMLQRYHLSTKQ